VKSVEGAVRPATDALRLTGTTRTVIAVALGVGLVAGAASLVCPTWVSAAVAGVTGAAAVVAGHIGASVNALFSRLRVSDCFVLWCGSCRPAGQPRELPGGQPERTSEPHAATPKPPGSRALPASLG